MAVYFKLIHRETFKPALFTAAFLVPLSIPGIHMAARLIPSKAPVEIVQSLPVGASARAVPSFPQSKVPSFPQSKIIGDSGYEVEFPSSQEKGAFGDLLTEERLIVQGWRTDFNIDDEAHGIDGVYVRYEKGSPQKIRDILIVENKVDSGRLDPGTGTRPKQMTNEWIEMSVDKMLANDRTRSTGELIQANPDLVRKELWRHNLDEGRTTISRLDGEAKTELGSEREILHYMSDLVRNICESKQPLIVCLPASR